MIGPSFRGGEPDVGCPRPAGGAASVLLLGTTVLPVAVAASIGTVAPAGAPPW